MVLKRHTPWTCILLTTPINRTLYAFCSCAQCIRQEKVVIKAYAYTGTIILAPLFIHQKFYFRLEIMPYYGQLIIGIHYKEYVCNAHAVVVQTSLPDLTSQSPLYMGLIHEYHHWVTFCIAAATASYYQNTDRYNIHGFMVLVVAH